MCFVLFVPFFSGQLITRGSRGCIMRAKKSSISRRVKKVGVCISELIESVRVYERPGSALYQKCSDRCPRAIFEQGAHRNDVGIVCYTGYKSALQDQRKGKHRRVINVHGSTFCRARNKSREQIADAQFCYINNDSEELCMRKCTKISLFNRCRQWRSDKKRKTSHRYCKIVWPAFFFRLFRSFRGITFIRCLDILYMTHVK